MVRELLLPVSLQPEIISTPEIMNSWAKEGVTSFYLIQLLHNDSAADPRSKCTGSVFINFPRDYRGEKMSSCRSCQQNVVVSVSMVKIELHLLP